MRFVNIEMRGSAHFFPDSGAGITVFSWDAVEHHFLSREGSVHLSFEANSPDDTYVAVSYSLSAPISPDHPKHLEVLNLQSRSSIANFHVHKEYAMNATFNPKGNLIAAIDDPSTIRVWDIPSQKEIARIPSLDRPWTSIGFLADNTLFSTISNSSTIYLHPIGPEKLIAEICRRSIRNLTQEEWSQYIGGESYRKTCPSLPWGKSIPQDE